MGRFGAEHRSPTTHPSRRLCSRDAYAGCVQCECRGRNSIHVSRKSDDPAFTHVVRLIRAHFRHARAYAERLAIQFLGELEQDAYIVNKSKGLRRQVSRWRNDRDMKAANGIHAVQGGDAIVRDRGERRAERRQGRPASALVAIKYIRALRVAAVPAVGEQWLGEVEQVDQRVSLTDFATQPKIYRYVG